MKNKLFSLKNGFFCIVVFIILYLTLGELLLPTDHPEHDYFCELYPGAWTQTDTDGSERAVDIPGELTSQDGHCITIHSTLPDDIKPESCFIFHSSKQDVEILIDGQSRAVYSAEGARLCGGTSPNYYIFVRLSDADAGKTVTVSTSSIATYYGRFDSIWYASEPGFWRYMFSQQGSVFITGIIMLIIGLSVVAASLVLQTIYKSRVKTASAGLGVVFVAVWIICNSAFRQLIFPNITVIGDVGYLMVLVMPYPFLRYMDQLQDARYRRAYSIMEIITVLDSVLCIFLHASGIAEFFKTFTLMALVMFASVLLIFVTLALDLVRGMIRPYAVSAASFVLIGIMAILQVKDYMQKGSAFNITPAGLALLFTLVLAVINTFNDLTAMQREKEQARTEYDMRTSFLSNMSHEIRTPINVILGMNELILRESRESHVRTYAGDISKAVGMLRDLIDRIPEFSDTAPESNAADTAGAASDSVFVAANAAAAKGAASFSGVAAASVPAAGTGKSVKEQTGITKAADERSTTAASAADKSTALTAGQTKPADGHDNAAAPRILIVDDINMNLRVFRSLLKREKLTVDTASNGNEALKQWKQQKYSMVFIDCSMPDMSGLACASVLLVNRSYNPEAKLILVTEAGDPIDKAQLNAAGFADSFSKPFKEDELKSLLRKHM